MSGLPKSPTSKELQELLPRSILLQAFQSKTPFPKTERIDVEAVYKHSFNTKPYLPILRKLSTYGIDKAHQIDFLAAGVLPDPEDRDFPVYALGLILILDQGPRALFDGIDERYTNCYFDPMALKLLMQLRNLPPYLIPYNKDRWIGMGFTVDHWIWSMFWFMAPITHSEVLENHDYQVQIWKYTKRENSRANDGLSDPYAEDLKPGGKLDTDVHAFANGIMAGPPTTDKLGRQVTFGDYVYWFAMIFHVHRPIIQKFGRYPYRNRAAGRISSPEEEAFCEKTHWFGAIDEDAGKAIMSDVESGRWSPLSTTE